MQEEIRTYGQVITTLTTHLTDEGLDAAAAELRTIASGVTDSQARATFYAEAANHLIEYKNRRNAERNP